MLHRYKNGQSLIVVFLLLTTIFFSCNKHSKSKSKLAEYGNVLERVMLSDAGTFRGFNLGYSLDSIQAKETAKLKEAAQDYLYYESKIDDTTGTFNITYNFDETGLNEIQSDIFITNPNKSSLVLKQFETYFNELYGPSETQMGFNVWTVQSENYGTVRINLSDESTDLSADKAPGKISLWIYPDKE